MANSSRAVYTNANVYEFDEMPIVSLGATKNFEEIIEEAIRNHPEATLFSLSHSPPPMGTRSNKQQTPI